MTPIKRIVRPSLAFFLMACAAGIASVAMPEFPNYLVISAGITGICAVVWLVIELVARGRATLVRWLGWLSFLVQATSTGLLFAAMTWLSGNPGPFPWDFLALEASGYLVMASWAPIPPATVLTIFQPKRAKPKDIEAVFT